MGTLQSKYQGRYKNLKNKKDAVRLEKRNRKTIASQSPCNDFDLTMKQDTLNRSPVHFQFRAEYQMTKKY